MFKEYDVVRTLNDTCYFDENGNQINIPKNTKCIILEKCNDFYTVEFNTYPFVYEFKENELEKIN